MPHAQLEKVARQRMLESAAHDSVDDVWLGRYASLLSLVALLALLALLLALLVQKYKC